MSKPARLEGIEGVRPIALPVAEQDAASTVVAVDPAATDTSTGAELRVGVVDSVVE